MHLNTAVSALMELVNELYAFGDGAPAASTARPQSLVGASRGHRGARGHGVAVRSSHGRGVVGVTGHAGGLAETVLALIRRAGREGRGDRGAGAGQRQAASRLTVPADTPESDLRERALAEPACASSFDGKTIKAVVVAKGKLINVVVQ